MIIYFAVYRENSWRSVLNSTPIFTFLAFPIDLSTKRRVSFSSETLILNRFERSGKYFQSTSRSRKILIERLLEAEVTQLVCTMSFPKLLFSKTSPTEIYQCYFA